MISPARDLSSVTAAVTAAVSAAASSISVSAEADDRVSIIYDVHHKMFLDIILCDKRSASVPLWSLCET